ncbi:Tn21-like transposase [Cupriavidus basilensis OR16]|uniref:Tn21-like transposase n=1 Tax=Cupriavidus basilensis OR16 TaxID=1127483 RepID=H1S1Z4_9BURK|nr:Tn21-like transposase [Cupriavidus basilensis OR16]
MTEAKIHMERHVDADGRPCQRVLELAHPVIEVMEVLRELYARKADWLPDRVAVRLGRAWQPALEGQDRQRALAAFEWGMLFALRVALRNGSVFLDHSLAFRSQAALLISNADWQARRNHFYGHLKLPQDAKAFLEPVIAHLDAGLTRLRDAALRGELRIDSAIHIDPLSAKKPEASVDVLRPALFERHPGGQLPEILLEIDSSTHFSWLLLGREPHSRSELLMIYAAVLARGTSMSAADLARMVPELSPSAIRQMMHRIADERKLRQAADIVLAFMHQHPIARHWGRADLASSDMMSLETTRSVWQARADPRRRTASIGMYTHVRDRWGIFYDQPILLNERQAGAAIEGVIRQSGSEDVAQLAVDTHGYTDYAMSLSRLLGFDARGQPAYEAGVHLGRLFRTIFLIDYFTILAFRHEMQHALNRGEAVHTVQRAIHQGKIHVELTRHDASLAAVSSALTLLSNAVMAWNTLHMQRALDAIEAIGGEAMRTEDLRQIAPTRLEGINLRGTFDFPIARYAHRLLPSAATPDPLSQQRTA